jgi:hypothetical protein
MVADLLGREDEFEVISDSSQIDSSYASSYHIIFFLAQMLAYFVPVYAGHKG